ncbi:MAG: hypothetical protein WC455_27605 [Dehalococcoidia bacterium]|jgi:hypothetical protein
MAKRKAPRRIPVAVSIPDNIPDWDLNVKPKAEKVIAAVEVTAQTPMGKEGIDIPILNKPLSVTQSYLDERGLKVVYAHGVATLAKK